MLDAERSPVVVYFIARLDVWRVARDEQGN